MLCYRSNAIPPHFDPTKVQINNIATKSVKVNMYECVLQARSLLNAAAAPTSLSFKDIVEKMVTSFLFIL